MQVVSMIWIKKCIGHLDAYQRLGNPRIKCYLLLVGAVVTLMFFNVNLEVDFNALTESNPDVGILLPTRIRGRNEILYQKDSVQELHSNWTEKMRADWMSVLKARQIKVREGCRKPNMKLEIPRKYKRGLMDNIAWVMPHHLIWCPIAKAASTTWVKNLLLLSGRVRSTNLHTRTLLKDIYPPPDDDEEKKRTLKESMKMMVVRQPFERLLSAYRDKMLRVANDPDPFVAKQQLVAQSYSDTRNQPIPYTDEELKKVHSKNLNSTNLVHPTFTQFLMKVHDDISHSKDKKNRINSHWRPFWISCDPCKMDYDVIAHVETLSEDQEYVIRELGLENILHPAHSHASRFDKYNSTSEAAKTYFKEVPLHLLKSLATLLQPDFELFGYSPDRYLALAAGDEA